VRLLSGRPGQVLDMQLEFSSLSEQQQDVEVFWKGSGHNNIDAVVCCIDSTAASKLLSQT